MNLITRSVSPLACLLTALAGLVLAGSVAVGISYAQEVVEVVEYPNNPMVGICHAANGQHPYGNAGVHTVSAASIVNGGHDSHDDGGVDGRGDIIPPFDYDLGSEGSGHYDGKNWDDVGQAIWENDCVPVPQTGSITILKETDDVSGDTQPFMFTFEAEPFDLLGDGVDTEVFADLRAGVYTITETMLPDGWSFGTVSCDSCEHDPTGMSVVVTLGEGEDVICTFSNTKDEELPFEYGPYCGDGTVNQRWEQCERGDRGCTPQCQWEEPNSCTDLTLAKIDIQNMSNTGVGDMTTDVYIGQGSTPIPHDVWFLVYWNGMYAQDADLSGYEDVPGLAVERAEGELRTVMHGTATNDDVEHIDGTISFWSWDDSVEAVALRSDESNDHPGNNRLEHDTDLPGEGSKGGAGDDEVWLDSGEAGFWLTTTTADDGFYTTYGEPVVCDEPQPDLETIEMCKRDVTGAPVVGWGMTLTNGDVMYELETLAEDGCVTREVSATSGPWTVTEEERGGWELTDVLVTGGVPYMLEDEVVGCDFFGQVLLAERRVDQCCVACSTDCTPPEPVYQCVFVNAEVLVDECSLEESVLVGSFEDPEVTNESLWQKMSTVAEWVIEKVADASATTLELHRGWQGNEAAEGAQYAELDGDHATRISQVVTTEPSAEYELWYAFAPRQNTVDEQNELLVSINDVVVATEGPRAGIGTLGAEDWARASYVFYADTAETEIAFENGGPSDSYGTFLDDVRLCKIADPEEEPDKPEDTPQEEPRGGGGPLMEPSVAGDSETADEEEQEGGGGSPLGGHDMPEGVVGGAQVSIIPTGAPDAGAGGTAAMPHTGIVALLLFAGVVVLAAVKQVAHERE